jgi:gamma-glutamyltranspeptidase/glutathione hydrolase
MMKTIFVLLASLAMISCTPTDPSSAESVIRYDTIHHPVVANAGMVVSQSILASTIGRDVLAKGGNAVDAAVATGFALAVTLPRAGNIGGSGFMLVHIADTGKTLAFDFRSAAPANFDIEQYRTIDGKIDTDQLVYGPHVSGVPGTVAGFYQVWQRYGSLPWENLLAPAITLASAGIVVSDDLAFALENSSPTFRRYPASATVFLKPEGDVFLPGDILKQSDLAWSLTQISTYGADAFYTGKLAERIVEGVQAAGGHLSLEDLASYQPKQRKVIETDYKGYQVISMPPVSGGGLALLQMLNVLDEFDISTYPRGSADSVHLLAEVMKRGAANRRVSIGDPDFVRVPIDGFLSARLARETSAEISMTTARPTKEIESFEAEQYESRDTTHFSVIDQFGNAVSTTYTLGYSFGSGFVPPGTGILLDNQVRNFKLNNPEHANAIAPGKRMASSMTPTIVLDPKGDVKLVTGSPGGSRIINVVLQLVVNVLDYKMNIAEATAAPRIYQSWRGAPLYLEPGFSFDTEEILKARGHQLESQQTMGSTQSIVAQGGLYFGAADSRRPGAGAVGLQLPPSSER